jgi:hypothetical protein
MNEQVKIRDVSRLTTGALICELVGRTDATQSLFGLLGLMVAVSDDLSSDRRWRMAGSLRDAAELIEQSSRVDDGDEPVQQAANFW